MEPHGLVCGLFLLGLKPRRFSQLPTMSGARVYGRRAGGLKRAATAPASSTPGAAVVRTPGAGAGAAGNRGKRQLLRRGGDAFVSRATPVASLPASDSESDDDPLRSYSPYVTSAPRAAARGGAAGADAGAHAAGARQRQPSMRRSDSAPVPVRTGRSYGRGHVLVGRHKPLVRAAAPRRSGVGSAANGGVRRRGCAAAVTGGGGGGGGGGVKPLASLEELRDAGGLEAKLDDLDFALAGVGAAKSTTSNVHSLSELLSLVADPQLLFLVRSHGALGRIVAAVSPLVAPECKPPTAPPVVFAAACLCLHLAADRGAVQAAPKPLVGCLCALLRQPLSWPTPAAPLASAVTAMSVAAQSHGDLQLLTAQEVTPVDAAVQALLQLTQLEGLDNVSDGAPQQSFARAVAQVKDWVRECDGLAPLAVIVHAMAAAVHAATDGTTKVVLHRLLQALRALENLTFLNPGNQEALTAVGVAGAPLLSTLMQLAATLGTRLVQPDADGGAIPAAVTPLAVDCLQSCLRVLINLTHHNPAACAALRAPAAGVTRHAGVCTAAELVAVFGLPVPDALLQRVATDVTAVQFDLLVLAANLLTNCLERDGANRRVLAAASLRVPTARLALTPVVSAACTAATAAGAAVVELACLHILVAVFATAFAQLDVDATSWTWPKTVAAVDDDGKVAAGPTPGAARMPRASKSGDKEAATNANADANSDANSTPAASAADDKAAAAAVGGEEEATVDVEDVVAGAYLALMLGCAMRQCAAAQASVRAVLPPPGLPPLGMVLTSFVRLQSDAGVLTREAFASIRDVLSELSALDSGAPGVGPPPPASPPSVATPAASLPPVAPSPAGSAGTPSGPLPPSARGVHGYDGRRHRARRRRGRTSHRRVFGVVTGDDGAATAAGSVDDGSTAPRCVDDDGDGATGALFSPVAVDHSALASVLAARADDGAASSPPPPQPPPGHLNRGVLRRTVVNSESEDGSDVEALRVTAPTAARRRLARRRTYK